MSKGLYAEMVTCKCGVIVLCLAGKNKNGDLLKHLNCKLQKNKEEGQ